MADLIVLYDEPINIHFPSHFKDVYLDLLEQNHGVKTKMIVMELGETEFNHKNILVKLKKSSTKNILKRIFYSIYVIFYTWKILFFNKEVKNSKYILVHDDPIMALSAYVISKIKNKKFIYRITHLKIEELKQLPGFSTKLLTSVAETIRNFLLNRADTVIVMSSAMKNYFKLFINNKIEVIPSCVDTSRTIINPIISEEVRLIKEKINKDSLCYLGTVSGHRGLSFIIKVISEIHKKGLKRQLNIFGVGSEEDFKKLKKTIIKYNLVDYVYVYNSLPMSDLSFVLQDVKIGISPYFYEHNDVLKYNSPLKTMDYMSFEMFVIGSDIDDHKETIVKANSGLVTKNNINDFSNAIIELDAQIQKLSKEELDNKINSFSYWLNNNRSLGSCAKKIHESLILADTNKV